MFLEKPTDSSTRKNCAVALIRLLTQPLFAHQYLVCWIDRIFSLL